MIKVSGKLLLPFLKCLKKRLYSFSDHRSSTTGRFFRRSENRNNNSSLTPSLSLSHSLSLSLSPGHAPPGDGDTGAEVPRERTDASERPVRFDRPVAVARAETETRFADEQNVRNGIFGSV